MSTQGQMAVLRLEILTQLPHLRVQVLLIHPSQSAPSAALFLEALTYNRENRCKSPLKQAHVCRDQEKVSTRQKKVPATLAK